MGSVARSMAWKGSLLALRMVSRREVAVTMCEEPAVREVKRKRRGSVSKSRRSIVSVVREDGEQG